MPKDVPIPAWAVNFAFKMVPSSIFRLREESAARDGSTEGAERADRAWKGRVRTEKRVLLAGSGPHGRGAVSGYASGTLAVVVMSEERWW